MNFSVRSDANDIDQSLDRWLSYHMLDFRLYGIGNFEQSFFYILELWIKFQCTSQVFFCQISIRILKGIVTDELEQLWVLSCFSKTSHAGDVVVGRNLLQVVQRYAV